MNKSASPSFSIQTTFDATPRAVFDAIVDVRSWWSGVIDGDADRVGAEFRYRYREQHDSKQRVDVMEPGRKIVWRVLDAHLSFAEHPAEWKGTEIAFELTPVGGKTELTMTHVGLVASCECYDACSQGWTSLVTKNLRARVATGHTQPDVFASTPKP